MNLRSDLRTPVLALHRFVFARQSFERWNIVLLKLGLHGLGVLNFESSRASGESHLIDALLPRWLGDSPTIFDVGAHIGSYSALLIDRFPRSTVHAFEPNPLSRESFVVPDGDPRLTLHPFGLGSKAEERLLYDRADQEGSSHATLYPTVISEIHQQRDPRAVPVTIRTLDQVCAELEIQTIDFLKIDVEGHELAVLDGGEKLLTTNSICLIQFEFNEMNVMSRTFLRDFRARLPQHQLFRLLPNGLLPLTYAPIMTELFAFQNILAVPKGWQLP